MERGLITAREVERSPKAEAPRQGVDLIGTSPIMMTLLAEIRRVARSDAKVLITGESGVGKELVAHAIHHQSPRAQRALAAVNCAGLSETLLESELFGHVKGAFTGAYRDKQGKLEMADGGTIFLDEVGEMTLRMQSLLLRFMETGELQKVGIDRITTRVNVRVIAATNRNLRDMITQGTFREDLYYRLNVIHLTVPALRERRQDIAPLVNHFLAQYTRENRCDTTLAPEAAELLAAYTWPGNVREVRNVMERLVVSCATDVIRAEDLPAEIRVHRSISVRPKHERRKTVADELMRRLVIERESFWTLVYPMYMRRDLTRADIRELVRKGLDQARGSYKVLARLFNMEEAEYKRFLNFLRAHDCQVSFKEFRRYNDPTDAPIDNVAIGGTRWR